MSYYQDIKYTLTRSIDDLRTGASLQNLSKELGEKLLYLNRRRMDAGYDVFSRKFPKYSRNYDKKKSYKYAKRRQSPTKYRSTSKRHHLRLTGNLFSSLRIGKRTAIVSGNKIFFYFRVEASGRLNRLKIEGHQKNGYGHYIGVGKSGKYKRLDNQEIIRTVTKYFR